LQDGGPRVVFPITVAAIGTSHPQVFSFASIETILRQPANLGRRWSADGGVGARADAGHEVHERLGGRADGR
jgi:hypothetical protein